jgi:hypothetical protein
MGRALTMVEALSAYIAGGYFLVKPATKKSSSSDLVPPTLISASRCSTDILPDWWAHARMKFSEEERSASAKLFGIEPRSFPKLFAWVESHWNNHDIEWPNVFSSPDLARIFLHELELPIDDLILIGLGYPTSLINSFGRKTGGIVHPMLAVMVKKRIPMSPEGEILGYEVLGGEETGYHSWLCYHYEEVAFEKFGVRPNAHGLIESLEDAKKIADLIDAEGTANGPWYPWLIVKYPL